MYILSRRSAIIGACASIALPSVVRAAISGPEYVGVWQAVNLATGVTRELERQTPRARVRGKGIGKFFGNAEMFAEVSGSASPVRFRSTDRIGFVMRVASQLEDPHSVIQFMHVLPNKGTRRMGHSEFHALGSGLKEDPITGPVAYNLKKYSSEFFLITPIGTLAVGEYVLSFSAVADGFFFGIDA